jgi:hypothetical protein
MSNPLVSIENLNLLIREFHKIESKFYAGQFLALYRENRRIIADLEKSKKELIEKSNNKKISSNDLNNVENIDYLIRQLYKIDSRLHAGQFINAFFENQKVIEFLQNKKQNIINEHNKENHE